MINKLDTKNIELTKILYNLKQSLDLYRLISVNASKINKNAGKLFLAHAQFLALDSIVLGICKVFEENKKNKLNSIPSIIDFIQGSKVTPKHPDVIENYIRSKGEKITKRLYYGAPLKRILQDFKNKNKRHFDRFKLHRDSSVAHADDNPYSRKPLPSYDAMEKAIFFGIDFYSMIHEAFVGGCPVDHRADKRVFASLYTVLNKLEIENIKKDFDK